MKTEYRYFSDITFLRKYTSPLPFLRKLLNDLFNQHGAVGLEIKAVEQINVELTTSHKYIKNIPTGGTILIEYLLNIGRRFH